ncbi:MAG: RdgB/HAM1 family non-canonical purine NTP pyrophosphatase [Clostridia bacterium]|nr:RdgB/HAM1 family non-canonical purine NTP pyrophosphatase [Clostridia bacterium]
MEIILATKNAGKVREMAEIMAPYNISVISQKDAGIDVEVLETGSTFEENAEIKARAVAMLCDLPVIADDSGLCIDALGGKPGIYSARYGGEELPYTEKIRCLLKELEDVTDRSARFECAMVLVMPDGRKFSATGAVAGSILQAPEGTGGFGYDSIFYSSELGKSFGVASDEEKNSISHRGRALKKLCNELTDKGVLE